MICIFDIRHKLNYNKYVEKDLFFFKIRLIFECAGSVSPANLPRIVMDKQKIWMTFYPKRRKRQEKRIEYIGIKLNLSISSLSINKKLQHTASNNPIDLESSSRWIPWIFVYFLVVLLVWMRCCCCCWVYFLFLDRCCCCLSRGKSTKQNFCHPEWSDFTNTRERE